MDGIIAKNITHGYRGTNGKPFTVLNDVNLELLSGECIALLGESGSGKSTMARLLLGIEKANAGSIFLDGKDVTHATKMQWRAYRRLVQGVFQDASGTLNKHRSVYQNMEEGLINLTNLSKIERQTEIYKLMDLFHIERSTLKTPARRLSGGEQRRVSLVRALSLKPKYLILDEVTSGLDLISTEAVISTLKLYKAHYGCSYMLITHDKSCAYEMADKIYVFKNGTVASTGTKQL